MKRKLCVAAGAALALALSACAQEERVPPMVEVPHVTPPPGAFGAPPAAPRGPLQTGEAPIRGGGMLAGLELPALEAPPPAAMAPAAPEPGAPPGAEVGATPGAPPAPGSPVAPEAPPAGAAEAPAPGAPPAPGMAAATPADAPPVKP
jgi:hypothetical protein